MLRPMADVRLAEPLGTIDGGNTSFTTPTAYASGALSVRVAGTNVPADQVTETDPANGAFDLAAPPQVGDEVIVGYLEPSVPDPLNPGPKAAVIDQLRALRLEGGNDFSIVAGEEGPLIAITVLDKDGDAVDLTGYEIYFMARATSEAGAVAFDKTVANGGVVPRDQASDAGLGIADVVFSTAETQAQSGKNLVWDCWTRNVDGVKVVLAEGARLTVRAAVRTTFP